MPRGRSTRSVHGGRGPDNKGLALSIHPSSVYLFDSLDDSIAAFEGVRPAPIYSRYGHPTGSAVEAHLAALQGTESALLFSSGMAAITTSVLAFCGQGGHVVASSEVYGGTGAWLRDVAPTFGIDVEMRKIDDLQDLKGVLRPNTRLVFVESPANPLLRLVDFEALFRGIGAQRPIMAIDSTLATPLGQDPVGAGFDLVIHSATKYLGGHDDLLAGAVLGSKKLLDAIEKHRALLGCTCDPFTAWLVGRGMKTLAIRWDRQCANALYLAERLEAHPRVEKVHYLGLPSNPQHALARKQMNAFGALLAFETGHDVASARRVTDAFRLIARAPSLGGVDTVTLHPATSSHRQLDPKERKALGICDGLIRLSVGIEDPEDLWEDLQHAIG